MGGRYRSRQAIVGHGNPADADESATPAGIASGIIDVVQTVTDLTKVVNGVRTVVVWDVDYKDGKVAESEIVFFALRERATDI